MRGGGSSKIRKYILENHNFVFFSGEYIGYIPAKPNNKPKHSQCSLHIHLHLFCPSLSSGSIRLLVCCWLGSIISSSSCPSSSPGCPLPSSCCLSSSLGFFAKLPSSCLAMSLSLSRLCRAAMHILRNHSSSGFPLAVFGKVTWSSSSSALTQFLWLLTYASINGERPK